MKREKSLLLIAEKGNEAIERLYDRLRNNWKQVSVRLCQPDTLTTEGLSFELSRERPEALFFSAAFFLEQFSAGFNLHNFLCGQAGTDFLHTVMLCAESELSEASIFGPSEILQLPLHMAEVDSYMRRFLQKEKTILLVESDQYESSYFKTTLKNSGFQVFPVTDLSQARKIAVSACPDLIICRSVLLQSGRSVRVERFLEKLKRQHYTARIPVMVYAKRGSLQEIEDILQAGAVDYVVWPGVDLLQRVNFLFQRYYGQRQKILIAGVGSSGDSEVRRALGQQNFQVFTTEKFDRKLADGTEPDLLIVDSGEESSDECFAFLQEKNAENPVPVILIGTDKSALLLKKCSALQVDDILIKPYTISALLRSIDGAFFRRMAQQNEMKRREVEREFLIGHEIQKSIMSEKNIRIDNKLTVASVWLPARILGGDFFGVFRTFEHQGRVIVCIADVCGKGLSAALLAVGAHSSLYSSAQFFTSPALLMNGLNRFLCNSSLLDDFFLTIFIACIDFNNGVLQYAVAGHNEMLFYSAARNDFIELSSPFCPCGIMDNVEYENEPSMPFSPGDRLILYTDGITEALNSRGEQFTKARLMDSLKRHIHLNCAQELAEAVSEEVREYIGEARQSDDITILVVEAAS